VTTGGQDVSHRHLVVYLNDHLAGSAAALELLTELQAMDGLENWARRLRSDIGDDRQTLEQLMRKADIAPSTTRQAAGWFAEKLAGLKTRLDDRTDGALHRLELIEALALGIDGKRALWTALRAAAEHVPSLRGVDYARLIDRAQEQRNVVEVCRIQAVAHALKDPVTAR
jgi:hypothetical protein